MRPLVTFMIATFLLLPIPVFATIQSVTATVQQPFGGSQSPDDARTAGIARAKREALERAGTYIESATIVKNSRLDSDEILALTAGVAKVEVIKQRNYTDGDAFGIEISVKVEIDTDVLEISLKRLLEDRNHLKDLVSSREREKKLLARIAELEKENQQKGKNKQQSETMMEEFQTASQGLTAVAWFYKASDLWDGKKLTDPKKAIEYLTQTILLDPNYAAAYYNRGIAYDELKQFNRAKKDYDQAISLYPNFEAAYSNRGLVFYELKHFTQAISDFNQAIRLNPNDAEVYYNRGNAYANLKQFNRAIEDFDQAIRINPTDAETYNNRGLTHLLLNKTQKSCDDLQQACTLGVCSGYETARQKNKCK